MGYKGCPNCFKTMKDDGSPCPHCSMTEAEVAARGGQWLCTTCGAQTNPITLTKGSFGIEIILWLLMILPGVLYSVWRLTTRERGCPVCRKSTLIPLTSPIAQQILTGQRTVT